MTGTRWILIGPSIAASLAALAGLAISALTLGGLIVSVSAGLAAVTPTPKGRT